VKALVVYDSVAGNTEKIARAIAEGLGGGAKAVRSGAPEARELDRIDLLVVGSPTYGGRPTEPMRNYLAGITQAAAKRLTVATFDTRMGAKWVRIFNFAAARMAKSFGDLGSTVTSEPRGFIVTGRAGPLADGEVERAKAWGAELAKS
jgi:flavodoxin